ncbi:hypothetical protein M885DRAFT_550422 [Pelagophyceae sp. CCMP2097]|nr:hypothetical protein M885DRAFT_550422 [Pelagophyceae sp. CCMP2097]
MAKDGRESVVLKLKRAVQEHGDLISLGTYAQCLFDSGEVAESRQTFEAALAKTAAPPLTPPSLRRAYAHYAACYATLCEATQDWRRGDELYVLAFAAHANCPYALGNYPNFLGAAKRPPDEIEAAFLRAVEAHPGLVSVLVKYGNFLRHARQSAPRAEAMLKRALELDPGHADALASVAVLLHACRPDDPEVGDLYARAVSADPAGAKTMSNYGLYLSEVRRDYAAARRIYEAALAVEPRHANSAYNFAVMLDAALDEVPAAVAMYERAIEAQPNHAYALYNLAVIYEEKLVDRPRAGMLYRAAIAAAPDDAMATADLGRFLAQELAVAARPGGSKGRGGGAPDFSEAEALLRRALALDSVSATAHAALGEIRHHQGEPSQARALLKLANQADANNTAARRLASLLGDSKKR